MAQVTPDEFHAGQGEFFGLVVIRTVFPAEGDGVRIDLEHTGIGEGGAGDIGAEVLEGAGAGAAGLDMYSPVFAPDRGIDRPIVCFEQPIEMLPEGGPEMGQVQEELLLFDAHELASRIEPGAGHQAVKVGVELQFLGPGMEDGDEAIHVRPQGFVGGELFAQGTGDSREEQVVGLLGARAEETGAQFSRKREGDQEVGSVNEPGQFTLDPAVGGVGAALRAGFVVAGVVGQVAVAAGFAGKDPPAQCRGAAVSDRPDGAMLVRRERRSGLEQLGNKTAQRPQHGGRSAHELMTGFGL